MWTPQEPQPGRHVLELDEPVGGVDLEVELLVDPDSERTWLLWIESQRGEVLAVVEAGQG